ncbi:TPA: DUF4113 domain-containing protein [Aeromonas veronii]
MTFGRVGFASQGIGSPEWMMRQEHLSPATPPDGKICRWRSAVCELRPGVEQPIQDSLDRQILDGEFFSK